MTCMPLVGPCDVDPSPLERLAVSFKRFRSSLDLVSCVPSTESAALGCRFTLCYDTLPAAVIYAVFRSTDLHATRGAGRHALL